MFSSRYYLLINIYFKLKSHRTTVGSFIIIFYIRIINNNTLINYNIINIMNNIIIIEMLVTCGTGCRFIKIYRYLFIYCRIPSINFESNAIYEVMSCFSQFKIICLKNKFFFL